MFGSYTDLIDFANPVNWAHPLNRGLVSWWLALPNQSRGITWRDLCKRNNGTLTGFTAGGSHWGGSNGRRGAWRSLTLDGTDDYVTTPFTAQYGDFTAIAWFRSDAETASQRVIDKAYDTGFWIGHDTSTGNQWGGGVLESSAPYGRFVTLTTGAWHQIASVRIGTSHTIYGDGGLVSASGTVVSTMLSATALYFGSANPIGNHLSGQIDDIRFYGRGLSSTEIHQLYRASQQYYPGLLTRIPSWEYAEQAAAAGSILPRIMQEGLFCNYGGRVA